MVLSPLKKKKKSCVFRLFVNGFPCWRCCFSPLSVLKYEYLMVVFFFFGFDYFDDCLCFVVSLFDKNWKFSNCYLIFANVNLSCYCSVLFS